VLNLVAIAGLIIYMIHMIVNFDEEKKFMDDTTASAYVFRFLLALNTAILGTSKPCLTVAPTDSLF